MSIFSRKTSVNVFLLSINLILLAIISRVVSADEATNAILENSIYLYYYESDDSLLDVGESQLYTFAPIPGEDITIVSYGLDDSALTSISLFDNNSNLVGQGTTNQITEKPEDTDLQSPFITAIKHTANSSGLYYFEVKNESGKSGLIRTMLFVGEPFDIDLTLIDELNPLLPSKAFMVAGDPDREWINELTGETIQGLRTEVDVLPIERIDRAPDVFLSYSTLSYLPDVTERLQPVTFDRWFNEDGEEIYLVNIRPVPEKETDANRAILEDLNYQTYNSNNFFFFEYLFSVGNGSDPIALDRGAGACAGLADRIDCVSGDPNLGRETNNPTETITTATTLADSPQITVSGEVVTATIDRTQTCIAFNGATGNPVTITAQGSVTSTTVCVPSSYIPATGTFTTGLLTVSGTQSTCTGTGGDDSLVCTNGDDIINALAGNDAIIADAGNDIINAGDGDDFILAGSGDDIVNGGLGNDSADGGSGNDTINLGSGNNLAIGGTGTDTFIIDGSHVTGNFSILSGGESFSTTGDGEQDTFDFNGNPTGTLGIYTESVDRLDFTDYNSGVTVNPTNVIGTGLDVFIGGVIPSNISGSDFADIVNLSTSNNNLNIDGNGGADQINTGSGADIIDAGTGDDTINSGSGNDTINVTDGDGNDTIDGGADIDLIDGISGSNALIVTFTNATGTIEDTVTGDIDQVFNVENINTGSGDDQFFISDIDNNIINAGGGDDVASITGGSGTIRVTRTGEDVSVSDTGGGIGTDQYNSVIQVNVSGSATNDTFIVNDANDNILDGAGGSDRIDYATTSEDILVEFTAPSTAQVSGTSIGNDTLINFEVILTDSGNDYFLFDSNVGTVIIYSRAGNDIFDFDDASGTLYLVDNSGNTFLDFTDYTDGVVIDLATNAQQTVSLSDSSLLVSLYGIFNNVSGSAFDDNISGTTSADTIYGGDGDDRIYGEGGADFLYGEDGNDYISGGDGDDTINAGEGNDYIDGGAGTELIDESANTTGLVVTLSDVAGAGSIVDGAETDIVDNVENIDTGSGLDTFFIGDSDNNIINAGGGDDVATVLGGSGTITLIRNGEDVDVTGTGIGTDEYNSVFQVNIIGSIGNDLFQVTDENDNVITGNGGSDTVEVAKNEDVNGTVTIIRTGTDVDVSGTGIGTDEYNAIDNVNVTGSTANDTFYLTDENNNTITGNGGTDIVNVSSTAGLTDSQITITRTGDDVAVTATAGIGNDNYIDIDEVNITGGDGDDIFNIFDALDNTFDGGAGNDTANYAPTTFDMSIILDGSSSYTITGPGVGTDILLNIENINTGSGNDTITIQDDADNAINGGGGNDVGTSIMDGIYSGVITIIRNPINVVTVSGSGFGTDVYTDVEQVNVTSVGGDDIFRPNDSNNNVFDAAGGTDWIDYSTLTGGSVVVNLTTGIATGDGTDTLIGFENISGSIGDDTLTGDGNANIIDGNTGNDTINAGGGDDTIIGGEGNDDIDGGAGTDFIDESANTTGLVVTLSNVAGAGNIVDGAEIDTLDNVENIDTGSGLDTFFISDSDDNIINAGAGNDVATISGGSGTITITRTGGDVDVSDTGGGIGTDEYNSVFQVNVNGSGTNDTFVVMDANDNILDGGAGTDSIDYATTSDDIFVDFTSASTANVSGASIGADTLINFEVISTDSGDDYFLFNATVGTVTINSRAGDDIFDFDDASGTLNLVDSSGNTFLDFTDYTDGVVIDLSSTSQQTVSLSDASLLVTLNGTFNNISGSAFADNIIGTSGADTIYGGAGIDTINGGDGADFLYGEDGDDIINGGDGDDTILGGAGNDDIDGGAGTEYIDASGTGNNMVVVLSNVIGAGYIQDTVTGEIDTVDNIENVDTGAGEDQFFISDSDDNIINAGAGDDVATVTGGSGTITITRTGGDVDVSDTGGGIGTDEYNSVELINVSGSDSDDTFIVSDANDNIFDGGNGTDTISYASLATPITVTLVGNQASISATSGIGADTLYNIENIETGSGADIFDITGTVNSNLNSGSGADIFDFNTSVNGSLTLETSDSAHLDFQDYDTAVSINLGLVNSAQTIGTGLIVNLSGTFTSISGSAFADNIIGTSGADTIYGGASGDTINGGDGDDFLYGEDGNDIINGGDGDDTILGGAGNDDIDGGAGTEYIDASGTGNDMIVVLSNVTGVGYIQDTGTGEIDTVDNVENVDTGAGADTFLISDSDDNIINAGAGNDVATVTGGSGTITITRTGGDVDVSDTGGGIGTDEYNSVELINVSGSDSDDTFVVSDANDNIFDGGNGNDTISYASLVTPITVTLVGNQASISATSGIGADTLYNIENIFTGSGADFFDITGSVNNGLNSGSGADIFFFNGNVDGTLALGTTAAGSHLDFGSFTSGGISIDLSDATSQAVTGALDITLTGTFTSISGTTLADNISGTTSADTIWAGNGDDNIFGDGGADFLYGEDGDDTIDGGTGNDTIDGGIGNDIIFGGTGTDIITGGTGDDYIEGGIGADTIDGGDDDDTLLGDTGNDIITGGAGNDAIDGGADTDTFDESASTSDFTIIMDSTSGTSSSAGEGNDTLVGIENINTGSGDDNFTLGDAGVNIIDAAAGTDTVTILNANNITIVRNGAGDVVTVTDNSTGVGNDVYNNVEIVNVSGTSGDDVFTINDEFDNIINGQGGTNEINYSLVTSVVTVNALSTGTTISSTGIGNDTLIDIQNITTGSNNDSFIIEENTLNNTYDGSAGTDTATYTADGIITASASGTGISVQVSGSDTDQLNNIENINFVGGAGDDTFIIQDTNDNTIDGAGEGGSGDTYDASFATTDITVTTGATVTAVGSEIGTDTLVDIENINTGGGDDTFIINTSVGGTFFFNAGEAGTLGNIFQFTGDGSAVTNITITSSATAIDVLDFSQFTGGGIDIDLSTNTVVANSLLVTFDNFIDDVIGTDQADTITGNSLDNNIDGGDGDDTINYSAGNDVIDGGTGDDTVNYLTAPDAITATIDSSGMSVAISGTGDTQTITNVENISGTNDDDTFIINEAVSATINAQGGTDTVDYSGLTDAINVDLSTGVGNVSGTTNDHTLQDVEDVIGSAFDDEIIGNSDDNTLQGGGGDDFIQGNEGNDIIDGGTGTNTVSYKDSSSGVNVNLKSGNSSGGDGNDTLTNIDNVSGSAFGDNISGTDGANVIYGGGGADTIYGNEGDDEIYGEAGNDIIYGGVLNGASGTLNDGDDTIYGGEGNDLIYGGNNNTGGGSGDDGNDVIEGGNGNDTIYGGNNNSGGGSGNDGDDTITDIDPMSTGALPDDTDTIYGDNNNTGGGTGTAGDDTIDVDDDDGDDAVTGDNQVDAASTANPGTDNIDKDGGDSEDTGDGT